MLIGVDRVRTRQRRRSRNYGNQRSDVGSGKLFGAGDHLRDPTGSQCALLMGSEQARYTPTRDGPKSEEAVRGIPRTLSPR